MIELFFTHGVKRELEKRIIDIINCINDIDYSIQDDHLKQAKLGETFKATRVATRLLEEVQNAEIIG